VSLEKKKKKNKPVCQRTKGMSRHLPSVKAFRILLLLGVRYASAKCNFFSFMETKIEHKLAGK